MKSVWIGTIYKRFESTRVERGKTYWKRMDKSIFQAVARRRRRSEELVRLASDQERDAEAEGTLTGAQETSDETPKGVFSESGETMNPVQGLESEANEEEAAFEPEAFEEEIAVAGEIEPEPLEEEVAVSGEIEPESLEEQFAGAVEIEPEGIEEEVVVAAEVEPESPVVSEAIQETIASEIEEGILGDLKKGPSDYGVLGELLPKLDVSQIPITQPERVMAKTRGSAGGTNVAGEAETPRAKKSERRSKKPASLLDSYFKDL